MSCCLRMVTRGMASRGMLQTAKVLERSCVGDNWLRKTCVAGRLVNRCTPQAQPVHRTLSHSCKRKSDSSKSSKGQGQVSDILKPLDVGLHEGGNLTGVELVGEIKKSESGTSSVSQFLGDLRWVARFGIK